ncbi:hypothetical protein MNBD_GAMMA16-378 [hydrothermal vent metagenome]|uniref:Putative regulatory protein FmdB zinc ribbon domain-containing protein n=1 Tax=hydrothermal vent metagenome TaxID=652676 RepID=A0A3B0YQQ7_9ZZZZ
MPIYEYLCESCACEFEKLQKMSDAVLTVCPECGKSSLKKLVSAAGFRLKGSGWYETDFKNKPKSENKAKKEGDAPKAKESSSKKPASKSND